MRECSICFINGATFMKFGLAPATTMILSFFIMTSFALSAF